MDKFKIVVNHIDNVDLSWAIKQNISVVAKWA